MSVRTDLDAPVRVDAEPATEPAAPATAETRDVVSDDALVRAARAGDERAFEALLVRHEAGVLRVLRLLGVRRDDREDVAQEVFVRVFRHLDGFRTGRPFGAWTWRIAVNATHDWRAGSARERRTAAAAWEAGPESTVSTDPGPGDGLEATDLRRRLEAALDHLSERERAVFVLLEMEGLTAREVAGALSITSITVRRHLGRARERLQRVLAEAAEKNPAPR